MIGSSSTPPFDLLLGRPTDSSVAVSLLPSSSLQYRLAWGTSSGTYTTTGSATSATAAVPSVVELQGLPANATVYYRVEYLQTGDAGFTAAPEHSFHTQRPAGSTFTFDIEADPHHLDNEPAVWQLALDNMLADKPDFLIDLGDTFMDEKDQVTAQDVVYQLRRDVRTGFFARLGHSVPLFLVNGNHDPELGWLLNSGSSQANIAVWGDQARDYYYPCPAAGTFYSGSTTTDAYSGDVRNAYYAFTWGDALFVMLDPFWYSWQATTKTKDPWSWTLGQAQYNWLQQTLAQSKASFKFVFIHHLVGGSFDTQARGGVELSSYFEWGGKNSDGTDGFAAHRTGWAMPIQDLLLKYGVTAVFHGHDHLYVHQKLDSNNDGTPELTYQEVPQPSRANYDNTASAAGYGYTSGTLLGNSGHLRVTVSPSGAKVDYVRVYLPADQTSVRVNRAVSDTYTLSSTAVTTATFPGNVVLGRPTASSVTANVLTSTDLQGYIEYGTTTGVYTLQTSAQTWSANTPVEVLLTNLPTDTACYYRLRFKTSAQTSYTASDEYHFHTQRAPGSSFTFCIQGDSHPERASQFNSDLYKRTLLTALADKPDFYMTIGDDFSVDTLTSLTVDTVTQRYTLQRPYLGLIGQSAPVFLVNGNHEQAAEYLLNGTANNVAVWAQNARNRYYSLPAPDSFYSGDSVPVDYIGQLRDYYAFTWGDALFVVIDQYWHSPVAVDNNIDGSAKRTDLWQITVGDAQYQWLKSTLENSTAKHKFVFAHHVEGTGRGGIENASSYEWGGKNADGTWGFTSKRPSWSLPLHQLMVKNGVTIFFQGHDHIWVHQQMDGVTYQTLSEPGDPYYALYNADAYQSGTAYSNTGYTRVTVNPGSVKVEYVRTWLPADETSTQVSGTVACGYVLGSPAGPLLNLSSRASVGTGDKIQIAGFVVQGTQAKRVLLRAAGPALASLGISGYLADPVLTLYSGSTALASNDDWDSSLSTDFTSAGAFAWTKGSKDSALVVTLAPGAYTAMVSGKDGGTGIALIEVYELP